MRKTHKLALLVLPIFLITACSTDGGVNSMTNQGETSTALPEVGGSKGSKPSITAPTGQAPATLLTNDIFVGSGKEP